MLIDPDLNIICCDGAAALTTGSVAPVEVQTSP